MLSHFGVPPHAAELLPPYPPWDDWEILTIEEAIAVAWDRLKTFDPPACLQWLAAADEEQITERLEAALARLLQDGTIVTGFSSSYFERPAREASVADGSGRRIKKSPDLTFRRSGEWPPVADPRQAGYFVECKIVDATHSVRDYANKGIARFCAGEYASHMLFAGMVAYVRTPPTPHSLPATSLAAEFGRVAAGGVPQRQTLCVQVGPSTCGAGSMVPSIEVTMHHRTVAVPLIPHSIVIRHLWLHL